MMPETKMLYRDRNNHLSTVSSTSSVLFPDQWCCRMHRDFCANETRGRNEERKKEQKKKTAGEKMRHNENSERSEQCRTRDSDGDNCYRFLSCVCKPVAKCVSTNVSCCLRPFQLNGSTTKVLRTLVKISAFIRLVLQIHCTVIPLPVHARVSRFIFTKRIYREHLRKFAKK